MTSALFGLGVCHLVTAWGLRAAVSAGRLALAGGGVAALLVALVPVPSSGGSLRHGALAAAGFTLLALWPVLAARKDPAAPWGLRPAPALAATLVMGAGAVWFLVEINRHGPYGVVERLVTCVQSIWPLVVVASCLRHPGHAAAVREKGRTEESR